MPEDVTNRLALTVEAQGAQDDLAKRLNRFAAVYRSRRSVRVSRQPATFALSVDLTMIEAVGPVIGAAAGAAGLRVVINDLRAEIRSSGLDGWASGVWAAIGNAVDEDDVTRSRGEVPSGDLFRHLRLEDVDGALVALDARPPLIDPVGAPADDLDPQKFDDVGWHEGPADEAGQPREHAFAHIGTYLAWIIRHDLHDPRWFPRDHIKAVKAGSMTGSDLADDIDWKLISDEMTDEGSAFTAARYDQYVRAYNDLLGDEGDYRVAEDSALYARVEPVIDRLYRDWVTDDRPAPEPKEPSPLDAQFDAMFEAAAIPWDELPMDLGPIAIQLNADGSYEVQRPERPHEGIDLEALIPLDVVDPPIVMSSVSGTHWGSSLLNHGLKKLGVRPRDVMVAAGVGGTGENTLSVTVYRVPGAARTELLEAFGSIIYRPRRSSWSDRSFGNTTVRWADGRDGSEDSHVAYWARDEVVLHVAGNPDHMEAVIRKAG